MIVTKGIGFSKLIRWFGPHLIWLFALSGSITALYYYSLLNFQLPWLPVSVIGTAVAFYVGFKNNQAYDRMWEARKIWGGIVNDSRTWGMMIDGYVTNLFRSTPASDEEILSIKQRLIHRHIAWLYIHRSQLLEPTPWEHISQGGHLRKTAEMYQRNYGLGLIRDQEDQVDVKAMLPIEEYESLMLNANTATQIINAQSRDLRELRTEHFIDDFRHMELENILRSFYELQGKNERIKKFPLPRQYANISRSFVGIFIALLPFSMIPELISTGTVGLFLSPAITSLIAWVYLTMELVGDYSENPFQGMANDIPTMSLCRTIEVDLREMLGETDLPPAIKSVNGVLM